LESAVTEAYNVMKKAERVEGFNYNVFKRALGDYENAVMAKVNGLN